MKGLRKLMLVAAFLYGGSLMAADKILISAEEAIKLIGKPNVVFANGDSETAFENGHIEGSAEMYAHHLHHADIMGTMHCAPLFMCPDEAKTFIESKGISNDTTVIAYDNFRGPNATGVYMYFKSFGHDKVYVLDGGVDQIKMHDPNQKLYDEYKAERKKFKKKYKKAKKAGDKEKAAELKVTYKEFEKKMKDIEPKLLIKKGHEHIEKKGHYVMDESKFRYDLIADKHEVKRAVDDIVANIKKGTKSKYAILDSRGMAEIMGERKMDNVARGGHIPGSTFIEWKNITDFDNTLSFKSKEKMQKVFDKAGITKDMTIYAYCHVGAGRSTELTTALTLLGYKNVKVYTGSWDEWGNDMNLPIRR